MDNDSILTILHISDFHYSKKKWREQDIVIDAFVSDLKTLCVGHRRPDIIVFTGDLVNMAGIDSHDEAFDRFISRVTVATGCGEERIFIVPGNHDAAQTIVEAHKDEHAQWREQYNNMSAMNASYDAGIFDDVIAEKFADFIDLEQYLSGDSLRHRNAFVSVYHIDTLNIDVVTINTAAMSTAAHKNFGRDDGFLIVPEYALRDAIKELKLGSFRIFAAHHPFSTLSEAGARYLKSTTQQHANIHLYGHMHDPLTTNSSSYAGDLYTNQAGAIFTARNNAYIGYSLTCVDRSTSFYETHLRTYFDDRGVFDEARDVVEQGRFYSSQQAREFWRGIVTPIDDQALRKYLQTDCITELAEEPEQGDWGERCPHEKFVAPPMIRTFVQPAVGDAANATIEKQVAFEELLTADDNFIIYAAAEYGRTTILRELEYQLLRAAGTLRFPRLPIVVEFCDIKHNVGNLLRLVKSRAIGSSDQFDVESLLRLGHTCVMFDDVVFTDQRRLPILREFVSRYPKARYIFSTLKGLFAPTGTQILPEMPLHFDVIELCVLRRREMRELVAKFNGGNDVDAVLDRLQSEISEINLPFTAANGSILMTIYEEQSGFRPINRSVLIEQFVDATLRKGSVEQSQRGTFDYANKTALLAHVAAWMATNNQYISDIDVIRGVMSSYIDRFGLNVDLDGLMEEFFVSRLFVKKAEKRLSFRYRAVLEYFIALQMRNDQKFKSWVMEEERYLQFVNEIQYFAGMLRNDDELIDEVGIRFNKLIEVIEVGTGKIDLNQLSSLKLKAKDGETSIDHLSEQLSREPLTTEERDQELETDIPRDVEERQEVFRPKIDDPGQRMLVALHLYSSVLKNMELIDDAEKRRHLAIVWTGWAIFLHLSLSVVTDLARHRRIRINGVLYEINAPKGISDEELARNIALNMPTGVSRLIALSLGTEKLDRQLREPQLDAPVQPLVFEFFRAALIADLRLHATESALRVALDRLGGSSYLLEALIWKIASLRRMDGLKQSHFDAIATPLAGAIANLKGGSSQNRSDEKRRQISRLHQEGVLLKLKRQIQED